jgi:hypothetical protein
LKDILLCVRSPFDKSALLRIVNVICRNASGLAGQTSQFVMAGLVRHKAGHDG